MKLKFSHIINILFVIIFIAVLIPSVRVKLISLILRKPSETEYVNKNKIKDHTYNIDLKGINTKDINLSELKGKTIFINYWGTWCQYCVASMPNIQKLYDKTKNNDSIAFVFIAMKDKKEDITNYLNKNNYTFPVYEAASLIDDLLIPKAFPTTFIISSSGEIILKEEGAKDWSDFKFN